MGHYVTELAKKCQWTSRVKRNVLKDVAAPTARSLMIVTSVYHMHYVPVITVDSPMYLVLSLIRQVAAPGENTFFYDGHNYLSAYIPTKCYESDQCCIFFSQCRDGKFHCSNKTCEGKLSSPSLHLLSHTPLYTLSSPSLLIVSLLSSYVVFNRLQKCLMFSNLSDGQDWPDSPPFHSFFFPL